MKELILCKKSQVQADTNIFCGVISNLEFQV